MRVCRWVVVGWVIWGGLVACTCDPNLVEPGDGGSNAGGAGGGGVGSTGGGAAQACIAGLTGLTLTPATSQVSVGANATEVVFAAHGNVGQANTDVTAQLTWSATRDDDTPVGTFAAPGHYVPQAGVGGTVTITATDGCTTATATLTIRAEVTLADPGPAATSRFAGPVVSADATKAPTVVYPSSETRFPRNIYKVLFQWRRNGHDLFRLTFDGPRSKTVIYTDGRHPECAAATATAACWESTTEAWLAIAGSNAGLTTTLTIDGVIPNDNNVYRAAAATYGFSKKDVRGAIFYWSTTAAGVRRATVSDLAPEAYVVGKPVGTQLPNAPAPVKCVACHTVSRSGKKMFGYTEAGVNGGYVYDVTLAPPPTPVITTQITTRKGFGTFHPDDSKVVATVDKKLAEFDATTAQKRADLPVPEGTNPDWSPTGAWLAYSDKGGDSPQLANLSLLPYAGDAGWGASRVLVSAAGQSNLFPSFSPTGSHVAYARGRGGHGDKTFQLFVVPIDGGTPIELVTANRVVNGVTTTGQHENNMPTWAPPGDYDWVAFNSVRPYGVVYPTGGTQQIWVAAIDRNKLAAGQDPSYPAFRFSFQGLTENNHRAFWTLDVRVPEDAGTSCSSLGAPCGTGLSCCLGTTCQAGACALPQADAGACLQLGQTCDQTIGPSCCGQTFCDVVPDGGYECVSPIN